MATGRLGQVEVEVVLTLLRASRSLFAPMKSMFRANEFQELQSLMLLETSPRSTLVLAIYFSEEGWGAEQETESTVPGVCYGNAISQILIISRQYGSGYFEEGITVDRGVAGRNFPFWFWPIAWGGPGTSNSKSAYLHVNEVSKFLVT